MITNVLIKVGPFEEKMVNILLFSEITYMKYAENKVICFFFRVV